MPKKLEDQSPKPASLHTKKETIQYADGTVETVRTETIGKDDDGNPTTKTEKHQLSDCPCANPFDLHPKHPKKWIKLGVTGELTDDGTPLCYEHCIPKNEENIKFNKRCAFFWLRKKTV